MDHLKKWLRCVRSMLIVAREIRLMFTPLVAFNTSSTVFPGNRFPMFVGRRASVSRYRRRSLSVIEERGLSPMIERKRLRTFFFARRVPSALRSKAFRYSGITLEMAGDVTFFCCGVGTAWGT